MYDKDRRRIVRKTTNPLQVMSKLETLALWQGMTVEETAAQLLERAVSSRWSALGGDEPVFPVVDCLCCQPGSAMMPSPS